MKEFDLKAKEWDINPVNFERSEAIFNKLREKIVIDQKMTVLDFGAGTGILGLMLAGIFKSVTLMDSSIEMVKIMNYKIDTGKYKSVFPVCFDLTVLVYGSNRLLGSFVGYLLYIVLIQLAVKLKLRCFSFFNRCLCFLRSDGLKDFFFNSGCFLCRQKYIIALLSKTCIQISILSLIGLAVDQFIFTRLTVDNKCLQ